MGSLRYGPDQLDFDDRTLAHLQIVIVAKLRKNESFILTGAMKSPSGCARYAAWIDCGVPIFFRYDGSKPITINRSWLDTMMEHSYTVTGLEVMPESECRDQRPST